MRRKGTYVIVFTLDAGTEVRVGALGTFFFEPGMYCYVGSAMGGLDQRVQRHLRRDKVLRWHIDYLTTIASCSRAYVSYPDPIPECRLGTMASDAGMEPTVRGFGCSDCDCHTHLFRADGSSVRRLVDTAGLVRYPDILG